MGSREGEIEDLELGGRWHCKQSVQAQPHRGDIPGIT